MDTGMNFAVKEIIYKESNISRYYSEVNILMKLQHTSIINFYGFEIKERRIYLFFDYLPQGCLAGYVTKNNPLDESKIFNFTKQILQGVSYLHNFDPQIIHRDIKGANILLKDENNVKLADFGLSKLLEATSPRSVVGTSNFMAPEVVCGNEKTVYTLMADIWSVGCTVVEMATGKPPFTGYLDAQIAYRYKCRKRPVYQLPESSSKSIKLLLEKLLHMNPKKRPTAEEALERFFKS
ncbi:mitogen-activated protein kinase kinase kinase 3-like isoform X1 [Physella acuta]|uniref:mitogen-activated protein kinase kinase kinase 3-like isoform X1 n=1 Tax=Physella acuta TaxID=109671 RepID=UPI0027DB9F48|nr:mitogen-activated protein kinase kinase kinase 3-like isoform X1 [Physella acuta]